MTKNFPIYKEGQHLAAYNKVFHHHRELFPDFFLTVNRFILLSLYTGEGIVAKDFEKEEYQIDLSCSLLYNLFNGSPPSLL